MNTIDGYIAQNDKKEASLFISAFSKLIRASLEMSRNELISLDVELEFIEKYVRLEQKRLNKSLELKIDLTHEHLISHLKIPPLTIQPLIENAIWHGIAPSDHPGMIRITDQLIDGHYCMRIEDNGIGIQKKQQGHKSLGATITRERFELINQSQSRDYRLEISTQSNPDIGKTNTTATIFIPR